MEQGFASTRCEEVEPIHADQLPGAIEVGGVDRVDDGFLDLAVKEPPLHRTQVRSAPVLRGLFLELPEQRISEQVVESVPVALFIERDHQLVRLGHAHKCLGSVALTSDVVAEIAGEPTKDGPLCEDMPVADRQLIEDLFLEIPVEGVSAGGTRNARPRRGHPPARRQVDPDRPPVHVFMDRRRLLRRQLMAGECDRSHGLLEGEPQIASPDLEHETIGLQG